MGFDEAALMRVHEQVLCPKCGTLYAWLGDHGACIALFGRCLVCHLKGHLQTTISPPEELRLDREVAAVIEQREARENATGRRVFPCVRHTGEGCVHCSGRGWIVGYPPGFGHHAPS
jgi:hypothetical protein